MRKKGIKQKKENKALKEKGKRIKKKNETIEMSARPKPLLEFGKTRLNFHNGNFDRNKNATDITFAFESVYAI